MLRYFTSHLQKKKRVVEEFSSFFLDYINRSGQSWKTDSFHVCWLVSCETKNHFIRLSPLLDISRVHVFLSLFFYVKTKKVKAENRKCKYRPAGCSRPSQRLQTLGVGTATAQKADFFRSGPSAHAPSRQQLHRSSVTSGPPVRSSVYLRDCTRVLNACVRVCVPALHLASCQQEGERPERFVF